MRVMFLTRSLAPIILALLAWLPRAIAADAETRAFNAASKAFQDGNHEFAERTFGSFVAQFPASPRVPAALLAQARAALALRRFQPASDLLTTNLARAGALADHFEFWLGHVRFQSGKLDEAAATFAGMVRTHTNSPLRLDAVVAEAEARFKLRQWPQVTALLGVPGGIFSRLATERGSNDLVVARGALLLGEAHFLLKALPEAERVLSAMSEAAPSPQLRWQRQFLLCQVQFARQRAEQALAGTTNLFVLAATTSRPELQAASVALRGEILQALGRPQDAVQNFEANLAPTAPPDRRREAFLKIVQLTLAQNRLGDAVARLDRFLAERTNEIGSDIVLLSLGELRLKQHLLGTNAPLSTNAPAVTNLLDGALADLGRVVRDFPKSPFLPQAQLARGWALLEGGKPAESLTAFQAAADGLPPSDAQAVARFKLADLQFAAGEITNAVRNYRHVVRDYGAFARTQAELVPHALYQMALAAVAARDIEAASEAVEHILAEHPASSYADRSLLLVGQAMNDLASPVAARKVLSEFSRFSNSTLLPEVKLALARTHEREGNWPAAIVEYDQWVARFPANTNLARAEFSLALAHFHAGHETNALSRFTNFVSRFATNALAARAQNWIGDYFFNRGVLHSRDDRSDDDFREAEKNYQLLFTPRTIATNWPVTDLTYAAQLKAGRAAFRRQNWEQAVTYFTNLINLTSCPPALVVEAAFAYGDTYCERPGTNVIERYSTALGIFGFIPQHYPGDPRVARAWGRMGDCALQLAAADPAEYAKAYENYRKVTNSSFADIATRSQAEIGLGHVRRGQAAAATGAEATLLLDEAMNHYLNVAYGLNVRGEESPDPLWVRDAALAAARVAESQEKWQRAIDLYRRVGEMIPALRDAMERKASTAREKLALRKG